MKVSFYKYQGTGNDFIMIDNRAQTFPKRDTQLVARLCDRRFGIGGDGLILLENDETLDFRMVYFNADGNEGSMCGNGGRCIVAFAHYLGAIGTETRFNATDGAHYATIVGDKVSLQMTEVREILEKPNAFFLDTGSPHHVQMVDNVNEFDVVTHGRRLRYGLYGQKGSNINFVEPWGTDTFVVRTYERGVEDETLSCGTGATAAALVMHKSGRTQGQDVKIVVLGGELRIQFEGQDHGYDNIFLSGPAKQVFKGEVIC